MEKFLKSSSSCSFDSNVLSSSSGTFTLAILEANLSDLIFSGTNIPGIIGTVIPIRLQSFTKLRRFSTENVNCVIMKSAPASTLNENMFYFMLYIFKVIIYLFF